MATLDPTLDPVVPASKVRTTLAHQHGACRFGARATAAAAAAMAAIGYGMIWLAWSGGMDATWYAQPIPCAKQHTTASRPLKAERIVLRTLPGQRRAFLRSQSRWLQTWAGPGAVPA